MHNWALYWNWATSVTHHCVVVPGRWADRFFWYDKLKRRWRIGAEMTDCISATGCSWADSQADKLSWADGKVDKWQLSWQIAPELRYDSWADISRPSWQAAAEVTNHSQADKTQSSWQTASRAYRIQTRRPITTQLTTCNWADSRVDKWQLSWHIAPLPTHCSWAYRLQLYRADVLQLSWHFAAELTYWSWADRQHAKVTDDWAYTLMNRWFGMDIVSHSTATLSQCMFSGTGSLTTNVAKSWLLSRNPSSPHQRL